VALCGGLLLSALGRALPRPAEGAVSSETALPHVRAERLRVPAVDADAPVARGRALLLLGGRVDVNRADEDELAALPGIGPVTAHNIAADRAERGPFPDVDSLTRVKGIGPATLKKIRALVSTKPASP